MPEQRTPTEGKLRELLLLIWAAMATVAALIFAALALFLFLQVREFKVAGNRAKMYAPNPTDTARVRAPGPDGGFANLRESDIPGRYKFSEGDVELGTMTLSPDHTFINKDGTTFQQYHWDISADGLRIRWQRSTSLFSVLEKPGVYATPEAPNGKVQRLEKME